MAVEDFGSRPATEDEIDDWVALVRAGRNTSRGYRQKDKPDRMRPVYGSGRASSDGDNE